jgi:Uma2 family endonuclease
MDLVEEPIVEYGQLDLSKEYTWIDYLKWKFTDRVELIRGKIVKISPAPNVNHQALAGNLYGKFGNLFQQTLCRWFPAPFDVRLPIPSALQDSTVVQPDLCVICDESKLDEKGCNGAPDLVVEILSPGNSKHDLDIKFQLYQESGVKEYWIIHPESREILVYVLQNEKYIGLKPFTDGMHVESNLFSDVKISVDEIFRNVK